MATATAVPKVLSANKAACLTCAPLRQVLRIIDTDVLGSAASGREGARLLHSDSLVSLKLAHEMAGIFTLGGCRKLVRYLLGRPEAESACLQEVSPAAREMNLEVERRKPWPAPRRWAITFGPERA